MGRAIMIQCSTDDIDNLILYTSSGKPYQKKMIIPANVISLSNGIYSETAVESIIIGENVHVIGATVLAKCPKLTFVAFKAKPNTLSSNVFYQDTQKMDIYVPWAENEVENAPWGATNATIHYNTTYDTDGNPVGV